MNGNDDSALLDSRKALAQKCLETIEAAKAVMALEHDRLLHTALTALQSDCQWCVNEMGGRKDGQ